MPAACGAGAASTSALETLPVRALPISTRGRVPCGWAPGSSRGALSNAMGEPCAVAAAGLPREAKKRRAKKTSAAMARPMSSVVMIAPNAPPPNRLMSAAPMARPASMPPQRCMNEGFAAGAAGAAAGAAGLAGAAPCAGEAGVVGAEAGAASFCAGAGRCLPRLLPPPKRLAASASNAASPRATRAITRAFLILRFPWGRRWPRNGPRAGNIAPFRPKSRGALQCPFARHGIQRSRTPSVFSMSATISGLSQAFAP
jgi:hypothetical protein